MRDTLIVQSAEVRTSTKEGKGDYGIITFIGMGVSPMDMFCNVQMINDTKVGATYDVEFKLKGKELSGIAKMNLVK